MIKNSVTYPFTRLLTLAFKILAEIFLVFSLLYFLEILFWWSMLAVTRNSGCLVIDMGLFKPGSFNCPDTLWYGSFLETFMRDYMEIIGIPLIFIFIAIVFTLPISLPILFILIMGILVIMNKFGLTLERMPGFPIIARSLLSLLRRRR